MLKHHCDICKKVIEGDFIHIDFRKKNYGSFETYDLCIKCLKYASTLIKKSRISEKSSDEK